MIVSEAYHKGLRTQRIYKGGEIVWFTGEILSLSSSYLAVGFGGDAYLTDVPLVLGDADNYPCVTTYSFSHGTTVRVITADLKQNNVMVVRLYGRPMIADARCGNSELITHFRTVRDSHVLAFDAVVGKHDSVHLVKVARSGAATLAVAWIGNHIAAHAVGVGSLHTGISAIAMIGNHVSEHRITVEHSQSGVGAVAKLFNHLNDVLVQAQYQNNGVGAVAKLINCRKITVVKSARTHAAQVVPVLPLCHVHGLLTQEIDIVHGSATPLVSFCRDVAERVVGHIEGTIDPYGIVLLSSDLITSAYAHNENHCNVADSVIFAGNRKANLFPVVEGGLTKGVKLCNFTANTITTCVSKVNGGWADAKVVSLSADITVGIKAKTEGCLVDWRMPICDDNSLYIRQVYESYQNGNDLVLSNNYSEPADWFRPIQSEDGSLYIRQIYETWKMQSDLFVQGRNWLAPIETESGLYIRQAAAVEQDNGIDMTN